MDDDLPAFMRTASIEHVRCSMDEHPKLWIAAARYGSLRGRNLPERLALVMAATEVEAANSVPEWLHEVQAHTSASVNLLQSGRTRGENPDRPARALFLQIALLRLLKLVEAPQSLSDDLVYLLAPDQPDFSPMREQLQAALLDDPSLRHQPSKLASRAGCSAKLARRYLEDGSLSLRP